jgi:hypothetical protein
MVVPASCSLWIITVSGLRLDLKRMVVHVYMDVQMATALALEENNTKMYSVSSRGSCKLQWPMETKNGKGSVKTPQPSRILVSRRSTVGRA